MNRILARAIWDAKPSQSDRVLDYLDHLKRLFHGTEVVHLALQAKGLLQTRSPYSPLENGIDSIRRDAITLGYINGKLRMENKPRFGIFGKDRKHYRYVVLPGYYEFAKDRLETILKEEKSLKYAKQVA